MQHLPYFSSAFYKRLQGARARKISLFQYLINTTEVSFLKELINKNKSRNMKNR